MLAGGIIAELVGQDRKNSANQHLIADSALLHFLTLFGAGGLFGHFPFAGGVDAVGRNGFLFQSLVADGAILYLLAFLDAVRLLGDLPVAGSMLTGGGDGFGFLIHIALGADTLLLALIHAGGSGGNHPLAVGVLLDGLQLFFLKVVTLGAVGALQTALAGGSGDLCP